MVVAKPPEEPEPKADPKADPKAQDDATLLARLRELLTAKPEPAGEVHGLKRGELASEIEAILDKRELERRRRQELPAGFLASQPGGDPPARSWRERLGIV